MTTTNVGTVLERIPVNCRDLKIPLARIHLYHFMITVKFFCGNENHVHYFECSSLFLLRVRNLARSTDVYDGNLTTLSFHFGHVAWCADITGYERYSPHVYGALRVVKLPVMILG